jgi:hypothetical protein
MNREILKKINKKTYAHIYYTFLGSLYTEIDLANENDVMNLKSTISYVFAGEVQYARDGNLDQICQTLIAGQSTPLETVAEFVRNYYGGAQLNIVAQDMFDYYKAVTAFTDDISKLSEIINLPFSLFHIEGKELAKYYT